MGIVKLSGNKKEVMYYSGKWSIANGKNEQDEKNEIDAYQKTGTYLNNLKLVWLDLHRVFFVPTQDNNYSDLIKLWTKNGNHFAYMQGDMDGGDIFLLSMIATVKTEFDALGLDVTYSDFFASLNSIRIAYFDDNNMPCGISIEYSTLVPALWTITVAHNTKADILQKKLTHFAPECLNSRKQHGELLNHKQVNDQLIPLLNSKILSQILSGILKADETMDCARLEQIDGELVNFKERYSEQIKAEKSKFDAICNEVTQLPDFDVESPLIDIMNDQYKGYLVNKSTALHDIKSGKASIIDPQGSYGLIYKEFEQKCECSGEDKDKAFQCYLEDKIATVDSLLIDYEEFEVDQLVRSFMPMILGGTILAAFVCIGTIMGQIEDEAMIESAENISNEFRM